MRAFFRSTLHVLNESKEPELLAELLKALSKYLRFLTPFPRIAEFMLKTLESLWSAPSDSENYQHVRLHAFMRLRQLALVMPFPFIEDVLKKTYLGYSRRAKFGTASNFPTLTFLGNCLVELYSLDYHSSYQHAFVYIRQLALLLRSAMQNKSVEAISQVYCWQFLNCAKLWVAVLDSAAEQEDGALMRSLIYPMVEILLGTVRFTPSPVRHFPLRLHCIRLLQQLAAASETFIPTTALLLDVFDWKEWTLPPKKSKKAALMAKHGSQLQFMVKLGKVDPIRTHEQLEAGISELFVLLHREVELYKYSPGFPEFAIRITVKLRQFSKATRNARWRAYAKACIEVCDKYSKNCVLGRSKLKVAPKDVDRLEYLKPADTPSMRKRHQTSIEKEQKALEAARPPIPHQEGKKRKEDDDDDDDEAERSDENIEEKVKLKKKKKKHARKAETELAATKLINGEDVIDVADEIEDGVNWLDDSS
jgi:nucleolar complex protein 2